MLASGGGQQLAEKASLPFLGRVPIDPRLVQCTEIGANFMEKFAESPLANLYRDIALKIISKKTIVSSNNSAHVPETAT